MKGQFFIMATVIMIYTLMTMTHYIYDFSNINLIQLKKMPQLFYMKDIKDALNKTVASSSQSLDCDKLETDIDATENFLKNEMISRGIVLTINHNIDCSSLTASFDIGLKTNEFYVSYGNPILVQPSDGVLWLKFNEGSGTKAYDSSPYGNDGTFYGEIFSDGILGDGTCSPGSGSCPSRVSANNGYFSSKALSFDGVNNYVNVSDSNSLHLTGNFTIAAWIWLSNVQSSAYPGIVSKTNGNPDQADEWAFYIDNSTSKIAFKANNINRYDNVISRGSWQMVTVQRVGNDIQFYINGTSGGPYTNYFSGLSFASIYDLNIGRRDSGQLPFNGTIDEIRIWNRTLSQSEIQNEMQSSMPATSPLASWSFEEPDTARYINDTHIWVDGMYGSALSFDGVNNYVNVLDSNSLNITNEMTIAAWIYPLANQTASGSHQVVARLSWNNNQGFFLREGYGAGPSIHTPEFDVGNGTCGSACWQVATSSVSLTPNNWYYITGTVKSNDKIRIYVNGTERGVRDFIGTINQSSGGIKIGRETPTSSNTFNGTIDEIRIWNRVLTQSEIQTEMNSG